ncbi:hypothetical protein M9H77_02898 [Catharanthus roseus]|uniref:Uncharacterized protein n=1 Tax=Catharanthus roseus TaxID=4058 RepID=A0ACC0C9W6_CATRO|nr:hypothetical protein M9H77_02898 [Catharanthus roseus]
MFPLYFHYEVVSRQDALLKPNHANIMEVPRSCKIRVVPKAALFIKNGKLALEIPHEFCEFSPELEDHFEIFEHIHRFNVTILMLANTKMRLYHHGAAFCKKMRGKLSKVSEKRNIRDHKCRLFAAQYELRRKQSKAFCKDLYLPSDMRDKHCYKLSKFPRKTLWATSAASSLARYGALKRFPKPLFTPSRPHGCSLCGDSMSHGSSLGQGPVAFVYLLAQFGLRSVKRSRLCLSRWVVTELSLVDLAP